MRILGRCLLASVLALAMQPLSPLVPSPTIAADTGGFYAVAAWPDGDGAFAAPGAAATSGSGDVYVADTQNNRVKKLSPTGEVLAIWGSRGTADGQFDEPEGISVGPDGRVAVADTGNDRVQVFDADGGHLATWGTAGTGAGQFLTPTGLAHDASGNLYVSDTSNGRIQVLGPTGTYVRSIGSAGAQNGQLDGARGVAVDASGYVYVADLNNRRIQKFTSAGAYVTQWGPVLGPSGQPTGSRYTAPYDVAVDTSGYVYIADAGEHEIERCSTTGGSAISWGSLGDAAGQLASPRGIAARPAGGVYVADTGNNRVEAFTAAGAHVGSWSGRGSGTGELDSPGDTAFLAGGFSAVADTGNDRVQVIDSSGETVGGFGAAGTAPGQFSGPRGIDASGSAIWIADTGNHRIQSTDASGSAFVAYGTAGGAPGQFSAPEGISVDHDGSILVADTGNNRIQRVSATGTPIDVWGGTGSSNGTFIAPADVAASPTGEVFVVDRGNNRIQRFAADGTFEHAWGSWGTGPGGFRSPDGIAVGPDGDVYVADAGNDRVQRFSADGTFVAEFGATGAYLGGMAWPRGVDVADDGSVLTAERDNHRVQLWGHDQTAPVTARSGTPSGWDVGYVSSPVTVTLTATDSGSGVAATYYRIGTGASTTYTAPFAVSAQGETPVRYWSVDRLGNTEAVKTVRVRIDSVAPAGTFRLANGQDYVTTTSVTADSAFGDAVDMRFDTGSGYGAWQSYAASTGLILGGEGVRQVSAQYRDWLGNTTTLTDTVTVDYTAPHTDIGGVPADWTVGPVILSLVATDSITGVERTLVSQNGGPEVDYSAPWMIASEGTTTVTYRSIDRAGNSETTQTAVVLIDSVAPFGSVVLDGGAAYATTTTVTVSSDITGAESMRFDAGTGFDGWRGFESTTTLALPGEGEHVVTGEYENRAGLTYETSATITVDLTAPVMRTLRTTERVWLPRSLVAHGAVSWTASDANGIAGYSWVIDRDVDTIPDQVIDGTTSKMSLDNRGPGLWYVHVRARDAAGLWSEAAHVAVMLRGARPGAARPDGHTLRGAALGWPSAAGIGLADVLDIIGSRAAPHVAAAPATPSAPLISRMAAGASSQRSAAEADVALWWPRSHTVPAHWRTRHEW